MYMERVSLAQLNHSQIVMVKDGQMRGQTKSFAVAQLCFYHVKLYAASSSISGGVQTSVNYFVNQIEQPPLNRFIFHDYHTARSQDVDIYVSVW